MGSASATPIAPASRPLAASQSGKNGNCTPSATKRGRKKTASRQANEGWKSNMLRAAYSVRSPPQPTPGLPGFGPFKICRKGAGPQPAGEGLGGWGPSADHRTTPTPALRADPPHKGEGKDRVHGSC